MACPPSSIPRSPDEIAAAAQAADIVIPDACLAGVIANLALLDRHAAILRDAPDGEGA